MLEAVANGFGKQWMERETLFSPTWRCVNNLYGNFGFLLTLHGII